MSPYRWLPDQRTGYSIYVREVVETLSAERFYVRLFFVFLITEIFPLITETGTFVFYHLLNQYINS